MAILTIDLPKAPRPQAAYRLAADCPCCGAPLVLRQNRQTDVVFTGCSAYPRCPLPNHTTPACRPSAPSRSGCPGARRSPRCRPGAAAAGPGAGRIPAASRCRAGHVDRTVRQLIALAHPDRWPDTPLAHELTVALVALRDAAAGLQRPPLAVRGTASPHSLRAGSASSLLRGERANGVDAVLAMCHEEALGSPQAEPLMWGVSRMLGAAQRR